MSTHTHSRVADFCYIFRNIPRAHAADHNTTQCKWVRPAELKSLSATLRAKQGSLSALGYIPEGSDFFLFFFVNVVIQSLKSSSSIVWVPALYIIAARQELSAKRRLVC